MTDDVTLSYNRNQQPEKEHTGSGNDNADCGGNEVVLSKMRAWRGW